MRSLKKIYKHKKNPNQFHKAASGFQCSSSRCIPSGAGLRDPGAAYVGFASVKGEELLEGRCPQHAGPWSVGFMVIPPCHGANGAGSRLRSTNTLPQELSLPCSELCCSGPTTPCSRGAVGMTGGLGCSFPSDPGAGMSLSAGAQ